MAEVTADNWYNVYHALKSDLNVEPKARMVLSYAEVMGQ